MDARKRTIDEVRAWLLARLGQWVILIRLAGESRRWRLVWYETASEREDAWRQIERILTRGPSEGEIRCRQMGAPRNQTVVFPWPGAADLYSQTEPPILRLPEVLSRDSEGREQSSEVEITGLNVRMVNLTAPPKKYSPQCAEAIAMLLYDTQKRHTAADLVLALEHSKEHHGWCQASIEASASYLRKRGVIDNLRDGKGTGYGLVRWDVNPVGNDSE